MKLKRNRRFGAEVATAALNDFMFFLLLKQHYEEYRLLLLPRELLLAVNSYEIRFVFNEFVTGKYQIFFGNCICFKNEFIHRYLVPECYFVLVPDPSQLFSDFYLEMLTFKRVSDQFENA